MRVISTLTEKAAAAGHASWEDAVRATSRLSLEKAGQALSVSLATIRVWRIELGLATDAALERIPMSEREHGIAATYRRGCRCAQCRSAWTEYHRIRRLQAKRRQTL